MNEPEVRQLLANAGQRALETMFFTMPDSISCDTQRPPGALVAASLTFQGCPPGSFGLILSEPVGRAITANFLGADTEEDVSPAQIAEVSCELTNIICGSVLTDLEANADFDLSMPLPVHITAADPGPDYGKRLPVTCRFELSEGSIVLYLAFGEAA
jgi:chemotaxis protein CheY-P-specific phosphatase CheC